MSDTHQLRELVHAAYHEGYRDGAELCDNLDERIICWERSVVRAKLSRVIDASALTVRHPQRTIPCPACGGEPAPDVDGWTETPGVCDVCGTRGVIALSDVPRIVGALLERIDDKDRWIQQLAGCVAL